MKHLALIFVLLIGAQSIAQNFIAKNISEQNVLYMGYDNKFVFGDLGCEYGSFELEAINCDLTKIDSESNDHAYIVKVKRSKERTAKVNFISDGKVVGSVDFVIDILPPATLYWGSYISGTQISNMKELSLSYGPGYDFDASFEIMSWESSSAVQTFKGEGSTLSDDFLAYVETVEPGNTVEIIVTAKGSDGIARKTGGSWIKMANR